MKHLKPVFFLFFIASFLVSWGTKDSRTVRGIQPGNLVPEMNWTDLNPDNKTYVLLQFWAASDARSRAANTQMVRTISACDDIRMISFSLDVNPAVFEGVLRADGLSPDTQFCDFKGESSPLYKMFRLQAGLSNCLVDRNGIILARDLSPEKVLEYLEKS